MTSANVHYYCATVFDYSPLLARQIFAHGKFHKQEFKVRCHLSISVPYKRNCLTRSVRLFNFTDIYVNRLKILTENLLSLHSHASYKVKNKNNKVHYTIRSMIILTSHTTSTALTIGPDQLQPPRNCMRGGKRTILQSLVSAKFLSFLK